MEKLQSTIKKLKALKRGLLTVVEKAIKDNEEFILALNYEDQLYDKGINSDGKQIKPDYATSTVSIKKRKGQPTNRVTLRNEGIFHKSFYIHYEADGFTITTTDPIQGVLTYNYGDEILGLTDENLYYVMERFVKPAIENKLKEVI